MPSANFSNKNIIAQWYVPAVRGTRLTEIKMGETILGDE